MRYASIALAGLSLITAQAWAHGLAPYNPYVSVGMGVVIPSNDMDIDGDSTYDLYNPTSAPSGASIFQLPTNQWNGDMQVGFENNLIVGFHFSSALRAEGEFLYQNMKRDIDGSYTWQERDAVTGNILHTATDRPLASSSSTVNVFSLMTNLMYDFENSTAFTPFIGAGLGIGWINSDGTSKDNTLYIDIDGVPGSTPTVDDAPELYGTAFAWQFKLGVNYDWKENMSFDLVYRLFGTTQFEQKNGRIVTNPANPGYEADFELPQGDVNGLLNNSVYLAFRYGFQ